MKNIKIIFGLLLFAVAMIFVLPITTGAITTALAEPLAGSNNSGTMIVNCTTNIRESVNATLLWSTTGNQSEWPGGLVATGAISNTSEYYNAAFDISTLGSLATYNFTCLVYNATDYYWTPTEAAAITVDNLNPNNTAFSIQLTIIDYMNPQTLTCNGIDGIDSAPTITRTIHKTDGTTVTVTTSPYTATGSDTNILGLTTWNCSITDDSGNTNETTTTFLIDTSEEYVVDDADILIDRDKVGKLPIILVIIFLIVITVIITAVAYKMKKK